jgi:hypothetical protein
MIPNKLKAVNMLATYVHLEDCSVCILASAPDHHCQRHKHNWPFIVFYALAKLHPVSLFIPSEVFLGASVVILSLGYSPQSLELPTFQHRSVCAPTHLQHSILTVTKLHDSGNYYSNKMHTFIIKSARYHNLYFMSCILPLHVSTRVGHLQGAQCQCLAKVIINYNLLKLC